MAKVMIPSSLVALAQPVACPSAAVGLCNIVAPRLRCLPSLTGGYLVPRCLLRRRFSISESQCQVRTRLVSSRQAPATLHPSHSMSALSPSQSMG
ncbi:hypothetical protein CONLIGDRAFT_290191 [Coniochaeta ligniaria NRRL 30616]|uniref:Secreted protein n=1 Tax=Coniochaeta ligniaria NRRL 30616 TaxID=1408157 RepID=A0A1J7ITF7_9PEZI|nr:hypothetical protein CONLIGDRAFT_290191 [Coniochaeta ligniaria NRRL 30616]